MLMFNVLLFNVDFQIFSRQFRVAGGVAKILCDKGWYFEQSQLHNFFSLKAHRLCAITHSTTCANYGKAQLCMYLLQFLA